MERTTSTPGQAEPEAPPEPGAEAATPKRGDGPVGRIEEAVTSVERVAETIRREAEDEAKRYLSDRRREADQLLAAQRQDLADLATELEQSAAAMRGEAERSVRAIEGAAARLRRVAEIPKGAGRTQRATRSQRRRSSSSGSEREPAGKQRARTQSRKPAQKSQPRRNPEQKAKEDAVMLRATELAVAGRPREEIAKALSTEFGIEDPAKILDRILGFGY